MGMDKVTRYRGDKKEEQQRMDCWRRARN